MKLYQKIARTIQAVESCNNDWSSKYENTLEQIERDYFPFGSGIEVDGALSSCYIDVDRSTKNKIFIVYDFHLSSNGGRFVEDKSLYDGWLRFDLIVTPELSFGFNMKHTWYSYGNDKYKVTKYKPLIQEYLEDLWYETLNQDFREF